MRLPGVLLIGTGDLADEAALALAERGAPFERLESPGDDEVRAVLAAGRTSQVLVVSRRDAFALRVALMVRYVDDDVPLLVTIFDPTMAAHVREAIPHCRVTSLADIVAPTLAGPCLGEDVVAVSATTEPPSGLRVAGDRLASAPLDPPSRRRVRALARALLMPYDRSAALLLFGALGLALVLVVETLGGIVVLDQTPGKALYSTAKSVVTVDANQDVDDGPSWYRTFVALCILATLVLEASFTAGLVNRLVGRRLTGLAGRRAVPRRDHVIVVGIGQVGLQLCLLLRECGIGVVAVDRDEDSESVGRARELGLPVVIGRGADPSILRRLSIGEACALAAVTPDDLENLSIAMAAHAAAPELTVVLRAGDGRLADETRSLFRMGPIRDVHRLAGSLLAAWATGSTAVAVVPHGEGGDPHLVQEDGELEGPGARPEPTPAG